MDSRYFGHNPSGFGRLLNICPRLCLGQIFSHLPKPAGLWQISAIHLWAITYILTLRTFLFIIVKYIWYFDSYRFFFILKKMNSYRIYWRKLFQSSTCLGYALLSWITVSLSVCDILQTVSWLYLSCLLKSIHL